MVQNTPHHTDTHKPKYSFIKQYLFLLHIMACNVIFYLISFFNVTDHLLNRSHKLLMHYGPQWHWIGWYLILWKWQDEIWEEFLINSISFHYVQLHARIGLCGKKGNCLVSWSFAQRSGHSVLLVSYCPCGQAYWERTESGTEHTNNYCKYMIIIGSLADNIVAIVCFLLRFESRSISKIKS